MTGGVATWLFDPSGLTPHGFCLLWEPGLLWLHALSDIGIGVAYFTIPFALVAMIRRRPDVSFRPVFPLFAGFILLCGTGHWLALLTLWVPAYGLEGVVKAMTALASILTAIVLWRLLPQAVTWPTPAQLQAVNAKLIESQKSELHQVALANQMALERSEARYRLQRAAEQAEAERRERDQIEAANASLNKLSRHLAKARDQAEQANRAKSRFLAGMSHELRTPLNGILGYAQLLNLEGGLNPTQSTRVDAMMGAGRHLLEMITCILDMSEIEAEHMTLRHDVVDIHAIALESLDLVRPAAEAKNLSLAFVPAPGAPRHVMTDPVRLRQILLNLLGNAVKFTTTGSIGLHLQVCEDGSMLRIEVADTGIGIAAGQRLRLFQDFERIENDAAARTEGAGLGLALSARLATWMGGRLDHAENPGGGSVFSLELPLERPSDASPSQTTTDLSDSTASPNPGKSLRVLIVDDVLMNREIATAFVRTAGHEVTCAEGGAEAVAMVSNHDFDVVLMDVRMPAVNGLEATRLIRAIEGPRSRVPIVALTAQTFTDQIADCIRVGMTSHVAKPFDRATLLAAIEAAGQATFKTDLVAQTALAVPPSEARLVAVSLNPEPAILDLPAFEQTAFEQTAAFIAPGMVDAHLQTIFNLGGTLLAELRRTAPADRPDGELAQLAHKLAGTAGMFGFLLVARLAGQYEHAIADDGSVTTELTQALCHAITVTQQEIATLQAEQTRAVA